MQNKQADCCLRRVLPLILAILISVVIAYGDEPTSTQTKPQTLKDRVGPSTEKRFPPLTVPKGFKATLFACDPLIEYPSVIALGPKSRSLFVAHDYVTGLGVEIVRRDEIRIVEDTDADGYADKSTVFAKGFNSIQGLAYHAGTVFAMHAPLLTLLRDTNGDGIADERRDLIKGLGLPPEENSNRLHCANGVVAGHDGWLYLALGDRGCDVKRPEGDRLLFQQGGILRCRPDGRDLHVFSTGLRNIYDIALDAELNVFVRDNENDGGDYMIRVCHCFHGSDHGYPYHYYERPDELMPPLADLGRGSSAGGTSYLETAFPKEFRESLFFCEWGRAIVRYRQQRADSSFAPMKEVDFAAGATDDPYGFKPTDLVVDRDGSLLISDWADGQRPKRGRGRIYRITYIGDDESLSKAGSKLTNIRTADPHRLISQLDSPSHHARVAAQIEIERRGKEVVDKLQRLVRADKVGPLGRQHAVWISAHVTGSDAIDDLFNLARLDGEIRVRLQAIRAIADLTDPILSKHHLDAGRGDVDIAEKLAALPIQRDPRVMLEVVIALGRLKWAVTPYWLHRNIKRKPDPAVMHAALQTFRRAENWEETLKVLDDPFAPVRPAALRAAAEQASPTIVDGLIARLDHKQPARRREYADLLTRVYKKPAPWEYWGFRPALRPANPVSWDRTAAIERALDGVLHDPKHDVRAFAIRRMMREEIPIKLQTLTDWLKDERNPEHVAVILEALKTRQFDETRDVLNDVIRSKTRADRNRLAALKIFIERLNEANEPLLLTLAKTVNDGPVLAELLREIGRRAQLESDELLLDKLDSPNGEVRAAAILSLAYQGVDKASKRVAKLLNDREIEVRRAAATAAGMLGARDAGPRLLELARDSDKELCRASLESLGALEVPGAADLAVESLEHRETQIAALSYLQRQGNSSHLGAVKNLANANRSIDVLSGVVRAISGWEQDSQDQMKLHRAIAELQGQSGALMRWASVGPIASEDADDIVKQATQGKAFDSIPIEANRRETRFARGVDAEVYFATKQPSTQKSHWLAVAHLHSSEPSEIECFASSNGTLEVWLNDRSVFKRVKPTAFRPNTDRFDAKLPNGTSQFLVKISGCKEIPRFHVRFRRKSSKAEHERLTKLMLAGRGNVNRGRDVFLDAEKSQCIKCHRLGKEGGRIGPDLAGIGSRFSRIHLIESILEPSRTVAPSYGTLSVETVSGRILSGVKVAENEASLTLGDNQGKSIEIKKSDIGGIRMQPLSTMPEGIEKRLTDREFIDLISFLLSQRKP